MGSKIFVNSAIATKSWRKVVVKIFLFLVNFSIIVLLGLSVIVWFLSLGHINFISFWSKYFEQIANKIFQEEG